MAHQIILQSRILGLMMAALVLMVPLLAGCDNSIDIFDEDDALYSVYGTLTIDETPNTIRVRDVNQPFVGDSTRELDATVTLENLTTGTAETLERSTIEIDGLYFHNFPAHLEIKPEMEYRLEVERSDGATVTSHATAPAITEVEAPTDVGSCYHVIEITFRDLYDPRLVELNVGFAYEDEMWWVTPQWWPGETDELYKNFTPQEAIDLVFSPDPMACCDVVCEDLDDDRLFVEYYHLGPEWVEYGIPVDPLESMDVNDGLGFFGALRKESFTIQVDTTSS